MLKWKWKSTRFFVSGTITSDGSLMNLIIFFFPSFHKIRQWWRAIITHNVFIASWHANKTIFFTGEAERLENLFVSILAKNSKIISYVGRLLGHSNSELWIKSAGYGMDMPFALNSLESKTDRYWEKSSMSSLMRSALFELVCFEGETYCSN